MTEGLEKPARDSELAHAARRRDRGTDVALSSSRHSEHFAWRARLAAASLVLIALGCGGSNTLSDADLAGHPDGAAGSGATGGAGGVAGLTGQPDGAAGSGATGGAGGFAGGAVDHRDVAARCAPTSTGVVAGGGAGGSGAATPPDAGAMSCKTDSDCGGVGYGPFCLAGTCVPDQCLGDQDCPIGTACGCSVPVGILRAHANRCLPSNCRTDADCSNSGLCSPTLGGGFYCRTGADTCRTNADCPGIIDGGYYSSCRYATDVGRWECVATPLTAG